MISASPFRLPAAPLETDLVAKYFRGLGDPIRLRILELLQNDGELSVGELVDRLALPVREAQLGSIAAEARTYLLVNGAGTAQSDADLDNARRHTT